MQDYTNQKFNRDASIRSIHTTAIFKNTRHLFQYEKNETYAQALETNTGLCLISECFVDLRKNRTKTKDLTEQLVPVAEAIKILRNWEDNKMLDCRYVKDRSPKNHIEEKEGELSQVRQEKQRKRSLSKNGFGI